MFVLTRFYYNCVFSYKTSAELSEAYESIFRVRRELFSLRPLDTSVDDTQTETETEYNQLCATIRSMCLFLVQVVAPATREVTDGTATSVYVLTTN